MSSPKRTDEKLGLQGAFLRATILAAGQSQGEDATALQRLDVLTVVDTREATHGRAPVQL
jgi:hypothetical protein